jgi:serine/threonine protein kinase
MLARPAAIKLIRTERLMDGSDLIAEERFQLCDFGITRQHELYYVMELLQGIDLDRLVAAHGPQPPARVVHILRQACRSLAEAHSVGLVHRDIKPANLHLGRLGLEYDFVEVLDFGLVKERLGRPAGAAELDEALGGCDAGSWSQADAGEWWESHMVAAVAPAGAAPTTRRVVPVEIG